MLKNSVGGAAIIFLASIILFLLFGCRTKGKRSDDTGNWAL